MPRSRTWRLRSKQGINLRNCPFPLVTGKTNTTSRCPATTNVYVTRRRFRASTSSLLNRPLSAMERYLSDTAIRSSIRFRRPSSLQNDPNQRNLSRTLSFFRFLRTERRRLFGNTRFSSISLCRRKTSYEDEYD